jgi:hypothetical protein
MTPIREVRIADIAPSPYTARTMDDADHEEFVKLTRERVLGVDREKIDEALDVVELSESAVYDIDESEYTRKVDVDEDRT